MSSASTSASAWSRRLHAIDRRRTALLDELQALEPSRLDATPRPGAWSVRQIVEHLVLAERDIFGDPAGWNGRPDRRRTFKHRALHVVVMFVLRFGIPVRVPSAAMEPRGDRSLEELRTAWDDQFGRFAAWASRLDRRGRRRAIFRHPRCGPITVEQAVAMQDVHLKRHSRQIRRILG